MAYALVAVILFAGCFESLGHSVWCQRFLDSMFPAHWLAELLLGASSSRGIMLQGSASWRFLTQLAIPISLVITLAQYYLVGLLVDKFVVSRAW